MEIDNRADQSIDEIIEINVEPLAQVVGTLGSLGTSITGCTSSVQTETINDNILEREEENNFQKPKRQRTSKVWLEFTEVPSTDGKNTKKVQCIHCKTKLSVNQSGCTSHFKRHLNSCLKRKAHQNRQQLLNFQRDGSSVDSVLAGESLIKLPTFGSDSQYDHGKMREAVAHWVLMHEHPFRIVDEEGFNFMQRISNPLFEKINRVSLKSDCTKVYEMEKKKLKVILKSISKISLTTDMWKSPAQRIEYMVITGHFIDHNWKLQKHVLNFVHIPPPRRGTDIADGIYKCLHEWEIENKIYTISVDNAAYNDVAVRRLRDDFSRVKKLLCGGKLFHVRCCAHILNLLVKDGVSEIQDVIENVRESVKFIKQSEGRLLTFSQIAHQLRLPDRKLILDCPTRWNSTYDMLVAAMKFKDVFPRFKDKEVHYHNLPSQEDWLKVEYVCEVLEVFSEVTNVISGSEYPTSNLYLTEIYRVKDVLDRKVLSENSFIRSMIGKMKEKFDKYWGECNLIMSLASIMDPRFKMRLIEFCFPIIYPEYEVRRSIAKVKDALYEMYEEYLEMQSVPLAECSASIGSSNENVNSFCSSSSLAKKSHWTMFGQFIKSVETAQPQKSDLDIYLDESVYMLEHESMDSFDVLEWWKVNSLKYRTLSKMACDILAIPISTVASESTFSAGSRVIDPYRASLNPQTVETLICGGDWIRRLHGVKKKVKKEKEPVQIMLPKP